LLLEDGSPKESWWGMMDTLNGYYARYGTANANGGVNTGGCHGGPRIVSDQDAWRSDILYEYYLPTDGRRKIIINRYQHVKFWAPWQSSCAWDFGNKGAADSWDCRVEWRFDHPGKHVVKFVGSGGEAYYEVHVAQWPETTGAVAIPRTNKNWYGAGETVYLDNYSYGVHYGNIVDCAWDIGDDGVADRWGCGTHTTNFSGKDTRVKLGVKTSDGKWFFGYVWLRASGDTYSGKDDYIMP
jgi:hypothetical protein